MERKIGEVFTYNGKTYQVVEVEIAEECKGCAFEFSSCCISSLGDCSPKYRTNGTSVIFKEINNMEIKNNQLTIDIPEGMEIDLENSNLAKGIVKFKAKGPTYGDVEDVLNLERNRTGIPVDVNNASKLSAIDKLTNIARYYNKDWTPDWSNSYEYKFYIYYSYSTHKYTIGQSWTESCFYVYFRFRNEAEDVINNPNFRDILDAAYKN